LVRANIADDTSKLFFVEEPFGTRFRIHAVRAKANRLNHFANRTRFDQLPCLHRGTIFETFAVHDRINTPRLLLYFTDFGELFEGSNAGLSAMKSFPLFITRTPNGARSLAMAELKTS
jgi:hypothetical protein